MRTCGWCGSSTTDGPCLNPAGSLGSSHTHTLSGGAVADGPNVPPSIVAYVWVRTA